MPAESPCQHDTGPYESGGYRKLTAKNSDQTGRLIPATCPTSSTLWRRSSGSTSRRRAGRRERRFRPKGRIWRSRPEKTRTVLHCDAGITGSGADLAERVEERGPHHRNDSGISVDCPARDDRVQRVVRPGVLLACHSPFSSSFSSSAILPSSASTAPAARRAASMSPRPRWRRTFSCF